MNFSNGYDPDKAPPYRIVMREPAVKRFALRHGLALPEAAALLLAHMADRAGAANDLHRGVLRRRPLPPDDLDALAAEVFTPST
ncbi:hypothetical protein BVG79_02387 [Ketogulonicigenium robustum]|uniref:Uncharacterized protein n=1 Tax=Ketogulonicigenium robustum TaxID=92947 RepID=A0A1W6P335_9RHOB|nr:hypothetical protein [Ketogulonicigenium robustum]ARO15727.1 hypothetical protein BVG79_02387 [Ketogulonicigenium robustum]